MDVLQLVDFRSPALAAAVDDTAVDHGPASALLGRTVGFRIEWPSFRVFCQALDGALTADYGTQAASTWWDVTSEDGNTWIGTTADGEMLPRHEELLARMLACDAGVFGLGACGSCTEAAVYDFAHAYDRGLPSVLVVTDTFIDLARVRARSLGVDAVPLVVVPHPFETLDRDIIRQIAHEKAAEVAGLLAGQLTSAGDRSAPTLERIR